MPPSQGLALLSRCSLDEEQARSLWHSVHSTSFWLSFIDWEVSYERAQAESITTFAVCLAIGAASSEQMEYTRDLVKEARASASKNLCSPHIDWPATRSRQLELYGTVLLGMFFEPILVGPVLYLARRLGVHFSHQALVEIGLQGKASEGLIVNEHRLYILTVVLDFWSSIYDGATPISPIDQLSEGLDLLVSSRFAKSPGDNIFSALVETFLALANAQRHLDTANRVGPVDFEKLCDYAMRLGETSKRVWDTAIANLETARSDLRYDNESIRMFTVMREAHRALIYAYACVPLPSRLEMQDNPKRLSCTISCVLAAQKCIDLFTESRAADLQTALIFRLLLVQLSYAAKILTSMALLVSSHVDPSSVLRSLSNLAMIAATTPYHDDFKIETAKISNEFRAAIPYFPTASSLPVPYEDDYVPALSLADITLARLTEDDSFAFFTGYDSPVPVHFDRRTANSVALV